MTELFEKRSGDAAPIANGTDRDVDRESEPATGQKVIHQAELESQLFKVCTFL